MNTGFVRRMALLLPLAFGAVTTEAADLKIGYVNDARVIEEAPQAEAALKKIEAEFSPREKKIVEMQNRSKQLDEEMEKNALVLKEADRRTREQESMMLKRDVRRLSQEYREDLNLRRNQELEALQKIVFKAIIEIAKQENFDLILHEGAIYAGTKVDITDKVLKKLGKK